MNFEEEINLTPFFKFWNRGDGIGEISIFNSIVAFVHGEQQIFPENYYHYDETLETYVSHEDVDFSPVSCFPGILHSENDVLKSFNNMNVDCLEHLSSLLNSTSIESLPPKPKGSVFDIFSKQEKFLISRDFNFEIIKNGAEISPIILNNFNSFSNYLNIYFFDYPEISIDFINHSFLNGNVYFLYQFQNKYFLHLVFNSDGKIIMGAINKSEKMKDIIILDSSEKNYLFICQTIIEKLNISFDTAIVNLNLISQNIPREKNLFFNDLIKNYFDNFLFKLSNSSAFIIERNISHHSFVKQSFVIDRVSLNHFSQKISIFGLTPNHFFSLLINDYFINNNKPS